MPNFKQISTKYFAGYIVHTTGFVLYPNLLICCARLHHIFTSW